MMKLLRRDRAADPASILAVITGLPRSGTTLVSRVFMGHPDIWAGFECGVLLEDFGDSVFAGWMVQGRWHWGVTPSTLDRIARSPDALDRYRLLKRGAGAAHRDTPFSFMADNFGSSRFIIDKTPAYATQLRRVMSRVDLPFFVVYKDFPTYYRSWSCRGQDPATIQRQRRCFVEQIAQVHEDPALRENLHLFSLADYLADVERHNAYFVTAVSRYCSDFDASRGMSLESYYRRIPDPTIADSVGGYSMAALLRYDRAPTELLPDDLDPYEAEDGYLDELAVKLT